MLDPHEKANAMAEHMVQVSRGDTSPQKQPRREVTGLGPGEGEYTLCELQEAIGELKYKKSPGPDEVHNEWLQHLGEQAEGVAACVQPLLDNCNAPRRMDSGDGGSRTRRDTTRRSFHHTDQSP